MASDLRYIICKDYYADNGDNLSDHWCILYGSQAEAEKVKAQLEAGSDLSWYDPSDTAASAFLYVDVITL